MAIPEEGLTRLSVADNIGEQRVHTSHEIAVAAVAIVDHEGTCPLLKWTQFAT